MKKQEVLKCLSILKASYPKQQLAPDTLEVYATMLADLQREDVEGAIRRLVCKSKWFPTVAEIRSEVAEVAVSHLPEPEVAWGEVWQAIGRWGMNRRPEFSSPEVEAAVDAIGWRTICLDENVMSSRARFIDAYRVFRERKVERAQLGEHALERPALSGGKSLPLGQVLKLVTGGEE